MYTHTHVTYMNICVHMYMCVYIYIYVCMYIYIYVYIYIYISDLDGAGTIQSIANTRHSPKRPPFRVKLCYCYYCYYYGVSYY